MPSVPLVPIPQSPAVRPLLDGRAVTATVLGNALEFYDFLCYTTFAVSIGHAFFPAQDNFASLLLSLATFGVGFFTRPLGGVLIGAYADRVGRRPALILTVALMAVGTLAIAITPRYDQIGIVAPLVLVLARLVQGLALGGEVGASTSLLLEGASPGRRASLASWQGASQGLATLTGALLALLLGTALDSTALEAWGWRIPFALGLLIVPVGVYIRQRLPETAPASRHAEGGLRMLWRQYPRELVLGVLVIMAATIATYVSLYMTTYARTALGLPAAAAAWGNIASSLGIVAGALIGGRCADRWGFRSLMMLPRLLAMLAIYPAFRLLGAFPGSSTLAAVSFVLAFLGAASGFTAVAAIGCAFPRAVRSAGLSIVYAVSVSVFGGTTQFVVAWLIHASGDPLAPSYYVIATTLLTLWAMRQLPIRSEI